MRAVLLLAAECTGRRSGKHREAPYRKIGGALVAFEREPNEPEAVPQTSRSPERVVELHVRRQQPAERELVVEFNRLYKTPGTGQHTFTRH